MARPRKPGIDYFPLDTSFVMDIDIRVLRNRFGNDGPMVYLYLISKAYESNGYYIDYDDDLTCIISADMQVVEDKVKQIIELIIKRKLLSVRAHEGIRCLTSKGVQKRFAQACSWKAKAGGIDRDVWLLDNIPGESPEFSRDIPGESPEFSQPDGTERKEKEIKLNKNTLNNNKQNEIHGISGKLLSLWRKEFDDESIQKAIDEAASRGHQGEAPYIRAILNNWKKEKADASYNVSDLFGGAT